MIEEFTRTMSDAERALLHEATTRATPLADLRGTLRWSIIWMAALTVCGLLMVMLLRFDLSAARAAILAGPLLLVAAVSFGALVLLWSSYLRGSSADRRLRDHDVPEIRRAVEDGRVAVRRVTAHAVIKLMEFEDEGDGYLFDIGSDRILFLKGQQYIPVAEDMDWPNCEFEIVRTQVGGRWVGIFCYGSALHPVRTMEMSGCREDVVRTDSEEVIEGKLRAFADSLLAR